MSREETPLPAAPALPEGPATDRLQKVDVVLSDDCRGCGYQGHEFGAHYPDSVCIQGYLWDADSGDADPSGEGWIYTNGGDIPCPHCNHTAWATGAIEEVDGQGLNDQANGVKREDCRHPEHSRFEHLGQAFRQAWLRGWDYGAAEDGR